MSKEDLKIIPAWMKIKEETLNSFYRANHYLTEYRKIPMGKKSDGETFLAKEGIWLQFAGELVNLYSTNRSTLQNNKKTGNKEYFKKLKVLDKHSIDISGLKKKDAIALFYLLQDALYKLGILNIGLQEEDIEDAFAD